MKKIVSAALLTLMLFAVTACYGMYYEPAVYIPPTENIPPVESVHFENFEELVAATDYIARVISNLPQGDTVSLYVRELLKGNLQSDNIQLDRHQFDCGMYFFEGRANYLVFLHRTNDGIDLINRRQSVFHMCCCNLGSGFESIHEEGAGFIIQFSQLSALARQRFMESIEYPPLEINVRFERTDAFDWCPDVNFPEYPVIIRSMKELTAYMSHHADHVLFYRSGSAGGLIPYYMVDLIFTDYTEEFFAEKLLIIMNFEEGSGSIRHQVDAVLENGDIHVSIPALIGGGTMDMAGWHIFIEICNSHTPENFTLHVTRGNWF